jgi:SAM-dependent methyltransferase
VSHYAEKQRLAFGRVADLYDRVRPSYPAEAIDAVLTFGALRAPARILEVGAGTGKATVMFAERGFDVIALEPSAGMARIARETCAAHPGVRVLETEFERWRPDEPLPALVSVCAWHWIDPRVRYRLAREALMRGGTLAAIWTFPDWGRCELRSALSDAYRQAAGELGPDFPMHPDSDATELAGDWPDEIAASAGFAGPEVRVFAWEQPFTAEEYCLLLQTHQDHILLEPGQRTRLLDAVAATIRRAGGTLAMPFVTHVCLAHAI